MLHKNISPLQKTAAAALNTWATVIEEVLSDTHLNYVKQEADASKLDPQSTSGIACFIFTSP